MTDVVVAYIPVLHDGYRRLLDAHGRGKPLYVVGPELYDDYRPLAKDVRRLDADLVAASIASWGICSEVSVLDAEGAERLALSAPSITLPAEDVSYRIVERFFPRCPVRYETSFLRWDKTKSVQMLTPAPAARVDGETALADLVGVAEAQARRSVDWWRQVGAAIRFSDGQVRSATNEHSPHPLSAYAVGDPRANFNKGVNLEISTATHAEAALIAEAAREGIATEGAIMYVTDFPCPPCAKLIAAAGVTRLYFRGGYAVLDGQDVLETAGVELVQVA
jgi:dCMP deaminase